MSSVDKKQGSNHHKTGDHREGSLKAARDALCEAESDLAGAMIAMAEANCKGVPKPERHLREIRRACRDAAKTLEDLRTALPSGTRRGPNKAPGKSVFDPF